MRRIGRARLLLLCVAGICVCLPSCSAVSQVNGRRPPTAAERSAVEHYREIMLGVLKAFSNEDWTQDATGDYDIDDDYLVTSRREVPFEITSAIRRTYRVAPGPLLPARSATGSREGPG